MYSLVNGAKGGLVYGELSMMTETNFKKNLKRCSSKVWGQTLVGTFWWKGLVVVTDYKQGGCGINCAGEPSRMIHSCLGPRKYCLFLEVRKGQNEAWGTQVVNISSHDAAMWVSLLSESWNRAEEEEDWKFLIPNEEAILQRSPVSPDLWGLIGHHTCS